MRALVVVIIKKGDQILVCPGHDDIKNEDFYRLPGGGIDFGELSNQALEREMKEELGAELKNIKYLGVLENIFTYNEWAGHEICFVYSADFADPSFYDRTEMRILDHEEGINIWKDIKEMARIYPQGAIDLL